ncbi:MAG: hypothetical protein LR015_07335 [Verrucomicrobia bacterium]|nr:hypothetical protein [Verrucomicrobiota bacterium]
MQPICHAMSVLGSRLGFLFNPADRNISLLRFDSYKTLPVCELVAGAEIDGERFVFPLADAKEGKAFDLIDMRISPCSVRWIGIHGPSNIKITLTAFIPFKPRDAEFSTIPVVQFQLHAEALPGAFRWVPKKTKSSDGQTVLASTWWSRADQFAHPGHPRRAISEQTGYPET